VTFVSSTESNYECDQTSLVLSPRDTTHLDKLDCFGDLAVQVANLFVNMLGCEELAYLSFCAVIFTVLADTFERAAMMMTTYSRRQEEHALFQRLDATEHFRRDGQPVRPERARAVVSGCYAGEMAESSAQLLQRVVVAPSGLIDRSASSQSPAWALTYLNALEKLLSRRDDRGRPVNREPFERLLRQAKHLPHARHDLRPMR
jgi:hypothetical protein